MQDAMNNSQNAVQKAIPSTRVSTRISTLFPVPGTTCPVPCTSNNQNRNSMLASHRGCHCKAVISPTILTRTTTLTIRLQQRGRGRGGKQRRRKMPDDVHSRLTSDALLSTSALPVTLLITLTLTLIDPSSIPRFDAQKLV